MNIEFEKIIEMANIRRVKLTALAELLAAADSNVQKFTEVCDWVASLQLVFGQIDAEGRSLLPKGINFSLECIGSIAETLRLSYQRPYNYSEIGLRFLKESKI